MAAATIPTLRVTDLDVSFGTRRVLEGIDLTAQPGRRFGLVGENGSGKSTLLRAIAATLPPRAVVRGLVDRPPALEMLGQEPPFGDQQTIGEVLGGALAVLRRMVADVERLSLALTDASDEASQAAYAEALDLAVAHDAWGADRRAAEAAERLGLGALDPQRRIGTLSGGQRTRPGAGHADDDASGLPAARRADQPPGR